MSKKIIAATIAFVLVFAFVFTACKDDEVEATTDANNVYGEPLDIYVTDENGNRVYNSDGAALVYATDENGNRVTNESGVPQTLIEPFVPISEAGSVEYLGYKLVLPEGWAITDDSNRFINEAAGHHVDISPINDTYENYYADQREMYDLLAEEYPNSVSWTEDVSIGAGCIKVVRFTLTVEGEMRVMYFFENSGNLYKILFESANTETLIDDSMTFCLAITYKPYKYYDVTTDTTTVTSPLGTIA